MNDFPSLSDLGGGMPKKGRPKPLSVASSSVSDQLSKKMSEVGQKERETEAMRAAEALHVPHIDLHAFPVSQVALREISLAEAEENGVVCFFSSQDQVRLGALSPKKTKVQEIKTRLEERTHAKAEMYLISQDSFDHVLQLYKRLPTIALITKDITVREEDLQRFQTDVRDFRSLGEAVTRATTTDSLIVILAAALRLDASDIHVEAEEEAVAVRLRLDGLLHDAVTLSREAYKKMVSRIKLVSSLKINITNAPQDGRFTIKLSGGDVDVRVSTVPTIYGESIVMRLLHQNREGLTLASLGLSARDLETLRRQIERPNGMIITTGPTGSGKTTTLYACMHLLNKPDVKILTLEDPVEYKMPGVNQSQIDLSKGFTFGKGLRAMLRQDPDIAMVGEIRDIETAEIAIQAALTGHLILSTIHTNSAAGAIPRFLSMGAKPFLLAPALNAVVGQRLVRRLAPGAKKEKKLSPEEERRVKALVEALPPALQEEVHAQPLQFYTADEVNADGSFGYKGRIGVYEIFEVTPEIQEMILAGNVSENEIEAAAKKDGMLTMAQDGLLKALKGETSIEEVFRVIE